MNEEKKNYTQAEKKANNIEFISNYFSINSFCHSFGHAYIQQQTFQ